MIIEQVKLKGFISFIDEIVDLRNAHVMLVFGPNGEGKSALLESIPFCFWGIGRGKTLADYINDSRDTLRVEVTFQMENVRYKKIRQYGKSGNINELYVDSNTTSLEHAKWKLISDDTKRKTDKELSDILGLDYDIFSNSIFFGQKDASSFIEGSASDRKELLCNLLGIQVYEDAESIAKDKIRDIETRIQTKTAVLNAKKELAEKKDSLQTDCITVNAKLKAVNKDIKSLQENIETSRKQQEQLTVDAASIEQNKERKKEIELQLAKTDRQRSIIEADAAKTTTELETIIDEGIEKVEDLQSIIDSKDELLASQMKCKDQLENIEREKNKIAKLKDKTTAQQSTKEHLIQQKSELETQISANEKKQKRIESSGAICPVIDKPCDKLSKVSKAQMIAEIDNENNSFKQKLEVIITNLKDTHDKLTEIDGQLDAVIKRIEAEPKLTAKLAAIESDLKTVDEATKRLPEVKKSYRKRVDDLTATKEKLEQRLVEAVEELNRLKKELTKLDKATTRDFDTELKQIRKQLAAYASDVADLEDDKNNLMAEFGRLKGELEQAKLAEQDAAKIQSDIDELKIDLRIYTELSTTFGKNGIQKDIIAGNVPVLEEKTNDLLAKFTKNSDFSVKFDLDPRTQSGKFKKRGGLDIIIYRKGKKPRALNMYSGGETVRIVFAILLSLSNLLTKRAGKKSQTLIIDERIAALDTEGIGQFIEIVKYIADQYKKILIVSHISELNEAFSNVITVNKSDIDGSKVQYSY